MPPGPGTSRNGTQHSNSFLQNCICPGATKVALAFPSKDSQKMQLPFHWKFFKLPIKMNPSGVSEGRFLARLSGFSLSGQVTVTHVI